MKIYEYGLSDILYMHILSGIDIYIYILYIYDILIYL